MGKLMVVVAHFLSLCAVLLALSTIAAAQPTPASIPTINLLFDKEKPK